MKKLKGRVYTGPSGVSEIAQKLRAAGVTVTVEGTSHVYVEAEAEDAYEMGVKLAAAMQREHGGLGWAWVGANLTGVVEVK